MGGWAHKIQKHDDVILEWSLPKKDTHISGHSQREVHFVEIRGILENSAHFELTNDLSTILKKF